MTKKWLLALFAVPVGVGIAFGPDMYDLYKLQENITSVAARQEAESGPWPRLTDVCLGCHGDQGHSLHQGYPSLAGQPEPYLISQLQHFASGARANPNMGPLAKTLTEDEIASLAAFYSAQAPRNNSSFNAPSELIKQGEQLVKTASCGACHGTLLLGQGTFPRLAGQGRDYLLVQLQSFADGTRKDESGAMNVLAKGFSEDQLEAIASYLASRQVTP